MIKPLCFPNIYIKKDVSEALGNFFDEVCVYGVSASGSTLSEPVIEKGIVKIIRPEYKDDDEFNDFLLTGFNAKPLYDPNRAFELTAELQKRVEDASVEDDVSLLSKYRLMRARFFLQMAYEYDAQSSLIRQELIDCRIKEQALIKELQGIEAVDAFTPDNYGQVVQQRDSSDFQLEKRFEAWIEIFAKASEEDGKSGNGLYITDSRNLIETLLEFEPDLKRVCSIPTETIDKEEVSNLIAQMTECDWDIDKEIFTGTVLTENNKGAVTLTLYILPENEPYSFFGKFASVNKRDNRLVEQREGHRNTVIGYIDI